LVKQLADYFLVNFRSCSLLLGDALVILYWQPAEDADAARHSCILFDVIIIAAIIYFAYKY